MAASLQTTFLSALSYENYYLRSYLQDAPHLYYMKPPDLWEFPAQIFSDNQFGQRLQYKMHSKFWHCVDCWQSVK